MPYIGNTAGNRFVASKTATQFSGNGSAVDFTLDHSVSSPEDILVSVDGVIQEPTVAYGIVSGTTLRFTAAPSNNSGNNIFVYYLFRTVATVDHPATSALSATTGTFTSNATVGGTLGVTGVPTFTGRSVHSGGITIANDGQIGSVGDADAMAISSSGVVTFSQTPVGVGGITLLNSGGISMSGQDEADFLSLPSGIKRIQINFNGLSASASDASALIRLGKSDGLVTSGYVSTSSWGSSQVQDTSGFIVYGTGGSNTISGIATINHMGSNNFVTSHAVRYNSSNSVFGGGHVALGGTLDRLRVQGVSGGTFDAGTVNITYEL